MKTNVARIVKSIIAVILNCFVFLVGFHIILTVIYLPAYSSEYFLKFPRIWVSRELTLNQDVTIDNSGHSDSSITLAKGTVITSTDIRTNGALYSGDKDEVHYHQYISLECFVEGEDIKEELKQIDASNKIRRREIMMPVNIKIAIIGALYLAAAAFITVVFLKKEKYVACVLSNLVLLLFVVLLLSIASNISILLNIT